MFNYAQKELMPSTSMRSSDDSVGTFDFSSGFCALDDDGMDLDDLSSISSLPPTTAGNRFGGKEIFVQPTHEAIASDDDAADIIPPSPSTYGLKQVDSSKSPTQVLQHHAESVSPLGVVPPSPPTLTGGAKTALVDELKPPSPPTLTGGAKTALVDELKTLDNSRAMGIPPLSDRAEPSRKKKRLQPKAQPQVDKPKTPKKKKKQQPELPDNSKKSTFTDVISQLILQLFQVEHYCTEEFCNNCPYIDNRGNTQPTDDMRCRCHSSNGCIRERDPSSDKPHYWVELASMLPKDILKMKSWITYASNPINEKGKGRVMSLYLRRFLSCIQQRLQPTPDGTMGKRHPDTSMNDFPEMEGEELLLHRILLNFGQLVNQPTYHEKTKTSENATGIILVYYYIFGPFFLCLAMKALKIPHDFRSNKDIIEELMEKLTYTLEHGGGGNESIHERFQFKFSKNFRTIAKSVKDEIKKENDGLSGQWTTKLMMRVSVAVWSAQFFLSSLVTCHCFGIVDAFANLLSLSDGTDREVVWVTAGLAHVARLRTYSFFRAIVRTGVGQVVASLCQTSEGKDSVGLYHAIFYHVQMNVLKLCFAHGLVPKVNLSASMQQRFGAFSELISSNTGYGNREFRSKVVKYILSMFRRVNGIDGKEKMFSEACMHSIFDAATNRVRPLPFYLLISTCSTIVYTLPQLVGSPLVGYTLVKSTVRNKRRITLRDDSSPEEEDKVVEASSFDQIQLRGNGLSVEPLDKSSEVLEISENASKIAVIDAEDIRRGRDLACCFDFKKDLHGCMTDAERIRVAVLQASEILQMPGKRLIKAGLTRAHVCQFEAASQHMAVESEAFFQTLSHKERISQQR
jgi:hypothetical protein